ncbi:MAG: HAD family hydrolase [Rhodobacteraceae bacterium]|nr:HAD family hydrolase [Paracoccaceae bacterium]
MTGIKGILFDKDGTLFDFRTTWGAWARSFCLGIADGDHARAAEISAALGYDYAAGTFQKDSVIISATPDDITADLIALMPEWRPDALLARINAAAADVPQAEPVPLIPLMQRFRAAGLSLGVATNDAEAPARSHLGRAGIMHLLDFVAGFDSGFGAKPGTGMHRGFLAKTGLRADQVVMVGDSLHDLVSGRDAGMATIAVLTGMAEADELAPYADIVLPHIGEIPDYLRLA